MKRIRLLCLCLLAQTYLSAQVSFTNQSDLLEDVFGGFFTDCVLDMNGDYLDDVVRVGNDIIHIDVQQNDGTFEYYGFPTSLQNGPSWSICGGDLDGNGFNDLLFGDGNAVSFVYANDDWTSYEEVAHPAFIFSQRSTMFDINNDGHLDAFVCHDVDQSHPYRNDGTGNLTLDQSLIETVNLPGNYSAIWVDYDNDGFTDLYVTKCYGGSPPGDPIRTNRLYKNNGDGTFSEVAEQAGMDDNAQSWSTVFEDFDNDGDFDAFIVNHDFANRLMRNNGDGTFTDVIAGSGIAAGDLGAWENASGDFNNDGFVDIFSELGKELYLNNGDMTFTGIDLPISSGGIGDLNNDGFLDVMRGNNLWINNGNDNNWLKINTVGLLSNRNGIGARVEIYGDWGVQIREVRSGQSFSPMSSLQIHFGIGQAEEIEQVVVKWPSGVISVVNNPEINSTLTVLENDCVLAPSQLMVDGDTLLCPGELVSIEAPAGFTSYVWSNGTTGTATIEVTEPGVYSAYMVDEVGCLSQSNTVEIVEYQPTPPVIEVLGETVFCEGESVTLTTTEAPGYTWSTGSNEQSIVVTESGNYEVSVLPVCPGNPLTSETVSVEVLGAPVPEIEDITIQAGNTALLTATGVDLRWYDVPAGGDPIGSGPTFTTPVLNETTSFYVESHPSFPGESQTGGKEDFSGPGGLPGSEGYLLFDAWENFTLLSVQVYVPSNAPSGVRTIQLVNDQNEVLQETTFDLMNGFSTLNLAWEVPTGTNYSLRCLENNLFRNAGSVDFPYAIGDVGEITGSSTGSLTYYYFYDWEIKTPDIVCVSDRAEAMVIVTGLQDLQETGSVQVFPNPSSTDLFVQLEAKVSGKVHLLLRNELGQTVLQAPIHSANLGTNNFHLDLSHLTAGMYFLELRLQGETAVFKVVVQ